MRDRHRDRSSSCHSSRHFAAEVAVVGRKLVVVEVERIPVVVGSLRRQAVAVVDTNN
jgi:hypothetical protein